MKKFLISTILITLIIFVYFTFNKTNGQQNTEQKEQTTAPVTRKDELELEGFINDYFYRRNIKDSLLFGDFNAYGSVITKSIVIYIYPKHDLNIMYEDQIKEMIKNDLHEQILNFPNFEWTKNYSFDVVVR